MTIRIFSGFCNRLRSSKGLPSIMTRRIAGRPSVIAPNRLQRQFNVNTPDQAWVTDITYLRTWQGWLYLAVVIDLHSRKVVGWSMKPTLARELAIDALLMAILRRKPKKPVVIHSDQGSQYGSNDWKRFCLAHNLQPSMNRRGNCWDNAVAESFLAARKKSGFVNASTRPGIWRVPMYSITSKSSTIVIAVTVIWAVLVPKPLNGLRREAGKCRKFLGSPRCSATKLKTPQATLGVCA